MNPLQTSMCSIPNDPMSFFQGASILAVAKAAVALRLRLHQRRQRRQRIGLLGGERWGHEGRRAVHIGCAAGVVGWGGVGGTKARIFIYIYIYIYMIRIEEYKIV